MEAFESLVKVSLSEWPTLQLAIEQGMGGPQAKEKEEWMSSVIVEFFTNEIGTTVQELAEYIEEIMDNEFDTVIHDSSSDLLATRLIKLYQMVRNGESDKINEVLTTKLKQIEEKRIKKELETPAPQLINNNSVPQSPPQPSTSSQSQEMEVDDGWTVVSNKKGRKKEV